MDKTKALQKLLNGTATKKEIEQLKQALVSGEISIGGIRRTRTNCKG